MKYREAKENYEFDIDNERKKRIEFENKLIKLKKEYTNQNTSVSELELKINNLLHTNQDYAMEIERFKNELSRAEEIYGGKIH